MSARDEMIAHYRAVRERMKPKPEPSASVVTRRAVLQNQTPPDLLMFHPHMRRSRINAVMQAVADVTGISPDRVLSTQRRKDVISARHISWWICRYDLELTYPCIAHAFSVDHSSVIHGVRRIDEQLLSSIEIKARVAQARERASIGHQYWGA